MKANFVLAPGTLPRSLVVVFGDDVVLQKTCDSAIFVSELKLLFGEPLLHPRIEGTENDFRRAKVELVNYRKPVFHRAGDISSADEFRGSRSKIPSFTLMPMFPTVVVAIFIYVEVSRTDKLVLI